VYIGFLLSSSAERKIFRLAPLIPIKFNKIDILGLFTNILLLA